VDLHKDNALQYLKKACELNNAKGCYELGLLSRGGMQGSFVNDQEQALNSFLKACDLDFSGGCNQMGWLYQRGGYPPGSDKVAANKAFLYFGKACSMNNGGACWNVANIYAKGLGEGSDRIDPDPAKALDYYKEGCNKGFAHACRDGGIE
jgi:hypothetical protein